MSRDYKVDAMPNLKQIATVLDLPVERLRNVAKKPIAGEAYDPKSINWGAIESFIENRLSKTGYDSVDAVYDDADKVEITVRATGGSAISMLEVEGSNTTPARKYEVKAGDTIVLKSDLTEYLVEYVNETIVVYKPISESGALTLSSATGNRVFNNRFTVKKAEENILQPQAE